MRSITIDILNEKALNLLRDLEMLKLIRLRPEKRRGSELVTGWKQLEGTMTRQSPDEIEKQLKDLRQGWE